MLKSIGGWNERDELISFDCGAIEGATRSLLANRERRKMDDIAQDADCSWDWGFLGDGPL
jgi:hypothetical protein